MISATKTDPSLTEEARPIRSSLAARGATVSVVVASLVLWSEWGVMRHNAFGTFGFDFGIFDQGVWLLSRFERPFVTIMGVHLFGDHTSFILLPLVPIYWVFPSAKVLIVAQAAAVSGAAIPTFLIAREKLRDEWLAFVMAIAILANAALQWSGWEQFHPDVIEVPIALFAFWFMIRRRWVGFLICVGLLLMVKEDVALMTFVLGLYVAYEYDVKVGLVTAALSAVYFASAVWGILPALNGEGTLDAWRVPYGGIGGLVRHSLTHPWDVASLALGADKPFYLWQLFAGFALVSWLSPSVVFIAAGPFASNLLSTFWYQYHLQYHYTTLITPVLALAAITSIAKFTPGVYRTTAVALVALAAVVTGYMWGPSQFSRKPPWLGDSSAAHVVPIKQVLAKVPPGASVSSQYSFVTHLDHRREIYEFPVPWFSRNWGDGKTNGKELPEAARVQYIVVPRDKLAPREALLLSYLESTQFREIASGGGVSLLKRVAPFQPIDPAIQQELRALS